MKVVQFSLRCRISPFLYQEQLQEENVHMSINVALLLLKKYHPGPTLNCVTDFKGRLYIEWIAWDSLGSRGFSLRTWATVSLCR